MANYFLTTADYEVAITAAELAVVTTEPIRRQAETRAIACMESYMRQHYLTSVVFAPIQPFLAGAAYAFGDRISLDAPAFSTGSTYSAGVLVKEAGKVYRSLALVSPGAFNPSQWQLIGDEGNYYADTEQWSEKTAYTVGQTVKIETAKVRRFFRCIQNNTDKDPLSEANNLFWAEVLTFTENPTNANYWVAGDNRDAMLMKTAIDLTLFECYHRVQPRNVPEMRIIAKEDAISWLTKIQKGHISLDLVVRPQDDGQAGFNISWTSRTPYTNNYY